MRRLLRLLGLLGFIWLALWGLASFAVPKLVEIGVTYAIPRLERAGITVDSLDHGTIRIAPTLIRASADGVSAAFDLSPTDNIKLSSRFEAQRVSVRLANLFRLRGDLTIDNFEVSFHEADRPRRLFFDRLANAHVHIEDLPILSPRSALKEISTGLEELFIRNTLVGNLEFRGEAVIRVRDVTVPAQLFTERRGDHFRLRFDQDDIETLARAAEVDLSNEQIEIISLFPLRVPALIEITHQARSLSSKHHRGKNWLQDALRHVSWSFLLTREFGADFAREVTDAQETKPGNTPNERSMDFHNNAVGRQLAGDGTRLADLPGLVRSHPDIIRHPDEVESRTEVLR